MRINWNWPHKPDEWPKCGNGWNPWYVIALQLPGAALCGLGFGLAYVGEWLAMIPVSLLWKERR